MKQFHELKPGDKIWVKFTDVSDLWQEEIVTGVVNGENGYRGSGLYYTIISTDKTTHGSVTNDDVINTGIHWPIIIHFVMHDYGYIWSSSEANSNLYLRVRMDNPYEAEQKMISSLTDIIKDAILFDLRTEAPLPEHAIIVGMSNRSWECKEFYNMHYHKLRKYKNEYGGYTRIDKDGIPTDYWSMHQNFNDFRSDYMFIVKDKMSGNMLAGLLNLIGNDWLDTDSAINKRQKSIEALNKEIELIKQTEKYLKEKTSMKKEETPKFIRFRKEIDYWLEMVNLNGKIYDVIDDSSAWNNLRHEWPSIINDKDDIELTIDIADGHIINWPIGKTASFRTVKIVDTGTYELLSENMTVLHSLNGYVPKFLSIEEDGWGDYLEFEVNSNGYINNWKFTDSDLETINKEWD